MGEVVRMSVDMVRFAAAPAHLVRTGLLGFVSCTVGPIRLHGLALRRTRSGRLALVYPERICRGGRRHALVRPTTAEVRAAIESQVLAALGLEVET